MIYTSGVAETDFGVEITSCLTFSFLMVSMCLYVTYLTLKPENVLNCRGFLTHFFALLDLSKLTWPVDTGFMVNPEVDDSLKPELILNWLKLCWLAAADGFSLTISLAVGDDPLELGVP